MPTRCSVRPVLMTLITLGANLQLNRHTDADKQTAINVFLGVDETNTRPVRTRPLTPPPGRTYQQWFDTKHLEPAYVVKDCEERLKQFAASSAGVGENGNGHGEFWAEYYRPALFTSLGKHFAYRMNSTEKLPGWVWITRDMNE